ncbi:hypothetical protein GQ55_8G167900 [Panicum hallii var. hallii]|uniref:Secreted protein n=1 Tax=Panicum hallii var. hallii TaxID=1504633 RepID=A0A2T7CNE8_9POAL|nr:hypothetical protein GQ55_8G167900 [Panicum hallii var. hallii]
MIGPRVFKTPLPLALLSLIFTVESSKPSTNSEGLGWPGRPTLLALPKAKLSSLATSKRRAKTFSFEARDEREAVALPYTRIRFLAPLRVSTITRSRFLAGADTDRLSKKTLKWANTRPSGRTCRLRLRAPADTFRSTFTCEPKSSCRTPSFLILVLAFFIFHRDL